MHYFDHMLQAITLPAQLAFLPTPPLPSLCKSNIFESSPGFNEYNNIMNQFWFITFKISSTSDYFSVHKIHM